MKQRLRIIILVLLVLAIVVVLLAQLGRRPETPGVLSGNGTIEATEVDVSTKVAGKILSLSVQEGDPVSRGQLLAVLDSGELAGQVESAQGNLQATEAALADVRAGTRPEEVRRLRAQVQGAIEARAQAQDRLNLLRAGTRSEDIAQLRAAFTQAQHQYNLLQVGPRPEDMAQLRAAYEVAQARLSLVKAGPRAEDIAQLRAAYDAAEAQVSLVKEGARPEVLAQLRAALAQAKTGVEDAEREQARTKDLYDKGAIPRQALDQATTRRDVAREQMTAAQARLADAQAGARPQEIALAQQAAEAARQRLAAAQAGARPQELEEAEKTVEIARQRFAAAENGARPQELAVAQQAVEIARQRLLAAQHGARPQEIAQAGAQVQQADAQVAAAQAALDLAVNGPRRETVETARARVEQARGSLTTAQASKGQAKIFAPLSGYVTLRAAEPGELVTPGMPIVRVTNLDDIWLRVFVPEPKIGDVQLGQRVEVTTDTAATRYPGRVIEIAKEPEFTPKNVQTQGERVKLVYGVKIAVENTDGKLNPGMPADAVIKTGR